MRVAVRLTTLVLVMFQAVLVLGQEARRKRAAIHSPVVEAVKRAGPAVVNISTEKIVTLRTPDPMKPLFDDEIFNRYFERYQQRNVRQRSLGSGVLFDRRGYIVTNEHVVRRASKIEVTLKDELNLGLDMEGAPNLGSDTAGVFSRLITPGLREAMLVQSLAPTLTEGGFSFGLANDDFGVILQALAKQTDALVVPMSMVALRCQTVRPDLTLRFANDFHPNQTMVYLTACTFYAALFNRSPEGLPIDTIPSSTPGNKDPDGGPAERTFSPKDRADLQRIAWEGLKQFQQIAASTDAR